MKALSDIQLDSLQSWIDSLARDIELTQQDRQDTIRMDRHNKIMNQLCNAYGFHLVNCPDCNNIIECPLDETVEVTCPKCKQITTANESPDLFW